MTSSGADGLLPLDSRTTEQMGLNEIRPTGIPMARISRVLAAGRVLMVGVAVPVLMRLPLPRLARVLEPLRAAGPAVDEVAVIDRTLWIVDAALLRGRPVVREGCLTRGITRYWFLRRAGVDVSLAFGTGGVDGRIEAHCWLVYDGRPLREPDDGTTFTELARIRHPGVVVGAS